MLGQVPALSPTPPVTAQSDHSIKLRERFLADVEADVEARLDATLHHARFIDLGLEQDRAAVTLPWGYQDLTRKQEYRDIWDAFEGSKRRLLLLGYPGAGKTTTVLHIARRLVQEAKTSADAPLPLIVNLSKFRLPRGERAAPAMKLSFGAAHRPDADKPRVFENWLVGELARYPGMDWTTARDWLREGRIAALLDGLDEFNDDQRMELAAILNETFLKDHPSIPVMICSRSNEYAVLQSNERSRLKMRGAVQLQPLSDAQVSQYLKAAKADALLTALPNDDSLRELTRTPLTLSMLVLAYGGEAPTGLARSTSLSESRFRLFQAYVERMLQRQARRDQNVQMDDLRIHDCPIRSYRHKPESIDRWLGWLALTLSVRMRTTFSSDSLLRILSVGNDPWRQPLIFWIIYAVTGLLIAAGLALVALPIVPMTPAGLALAAGMIAFGWLLLPWAARGERGSASGELIIGGTVLGLVALVPASAAHFAAAPFGGVISPFLAMPILLSLILLMIYWLAERKRRLDGHFHEKNNKISIAVIPLIIAVLIPALPIIDHYMTPIWPSGISETINDVLTGIISYGLLVFSIMIQSGVWRRGIRELATFTAAAAAAGIGLAAAIWLIGAPHWWLVLALLVASSFAFLAVSSVTAGPSIAVATLIVAPAGLLGGPPGALFSAIALCLLAIYAAEFRPSGRVLSPGEFHWSGEFHPSGRTAFSDALDKLFAHADRVILGRLAWFALALFRRTPFRRRYFLDSAVDAFLLKRSMREFEFVHRLLRDYFALRELMPRLRSEELATRVQTIRSLGFQGEAALDILVEFVEQGDTPIKAAALSALSHIPSPTSDEALKAHAGDPALEVRIALLDAMSRLGSETTRHIQTLMQPLLDLAEIEAIVSSLPESRSGSLYVAHRGEDAIEPLLSLLREGKAPPATIGRYLGDVSELAHVDFSLYANDRDPRVRAAAATAIPRYGNFQELDILTRLSKDSSQLVRTAAQAKLSVFDRRSGPHPAP